MDKIRGRMIWLTREYGRLLHGCGSTNRPILQQTLAQCHVLSCIALKCVAEAAALCLQILALRLQVLYVRLLPLPGFHCGISVPHLPDKFTRQVVFIQEIKLPNYIYNL